MFETWHSIRKVLTQKKKKKEKMFARKGKTSVASFRGYWRETDARDVLPIEFIIYSRAFSPLDKTITFDFTLDRASNQR